ncbi:MAG: PIN domain-containing protein [Deltaproteobacteria bacterium]|nr:PIN domain-containing protein [Deltaproteobacteria bacterium]
MSKRISVFLDTSALFAGIWSAEGGARMILKLGEAGVIRLLASPQVLSEIERALRRKAPDMLGILALILDRSGIAISPEPTEEAVGKTRSLIGHPGDVRVLAAAMESGADYFVTLDRAHFLDNPDLQDEVSFPIVTPGDFLVWYRKVVMKGEVEEKDP